MRVLHIFCHPLHDSYHGAILERLGSGLRDAGHAVDLLDLYAEGFDPVLGPQERRDYHDLERNRAGIERYVERILRAEGLVVQFPVWNFGLPAMLKGFLDRVFVPGFAFDMSDPARVRPLLTHVRKLLAVTTYGQPWWAAAYMGDPPRKAMTRHLPWYFGRGTRVRYLALRHMNVASPACLERFLERAYRAARNF